MVHPICPLPCEVTPVLPPHTGAVSALASPMDAIVGYNWVMAAGPWKAYQ